MNRRLRNCMFVLLASVVLVGSLGASNANAASKPPAPGRVPAGCASHTYGQGSSGTCVHWIQVAVNFNNYYYHWHGLIATDSSFGPATKAAVVAFQNGCNAALRSWHASKGYMSGGEVGVNTWPALETSCYQG